MVGLDFHFLQLWTLSQCMILCHISEYNCFTNWHIYLNIFIFYLCVCMYVSVWACRYLQTSIDARRGCWASRSWWYRWFGAAQCASGNKTLVFFNSTFNLWDIFPAPLKGIFRSRIIISMNSHLNSWWYSEIVLQRSYTTLFAQTERDNSFLSPLLIARIM